MSNDLIQWICVGVVFLIIVVWIIRYVRGLVIWSRGIKRQGGASKPPCCGGREKPTPRPGAKTASCCRGEDDNKPRHGGGPCAGCGADCPLSGSVK